MLIDIEIPPANEPLELADHGFRKTLAYNKHLLADIDMPRFRYARTESLIIKVGGNGSTNRYGLYCYTFHFFLLPHSSQRYTLHLIS